MKILFVSNLYPNLQEPSRGMFNAQQVDALAQHCSITKVIAPTSRAQPDEMRNGYTVAHPSFRTVPVLSRPFNGWLFARSIALDIQPSTFDLVLVNWAYPDAYGVMLLAEKYNFPFATTVQGSDVNLLFRNRRRKKQVLRALRAGRAVFCRSDALRDKLAAEGIAATTVYNGVDRTHFHPLDHAEACRQLGLSAERRRILYVGNLQPVKGPTVLAEAYEAVSGQRSAVSGTDLVFIGDGPDRDKVAKILSQVSSFNSQVSLVGSKPHHEVALWLNACDVLCLPSFNEGLPNVCIEAAACGLPVVASNVGGVPEIIRDGENGLLVPPGNPEALATALNTALTRTWDRTSLVESVKQFDWDANARQVVNNLKSALHFKTV